jgi:CRP/FNR family transcriptional regulator
MNSPYGLEMVEDCVSCTLRRNHGFCNFSPALQAQFDRLGHHSIFPAGALLFIEGQRPRGAYILCSGHVKLSTTSPSGRVLILKVAGPGEVLGLSAILSGTVCELTAETARPAQVNFIEREVLLEFLRRNGEAGLHSAKALSTEFQAAFRDVQDIIMARSSAGKLARLILSWTAGQDGKEIRVRSTFTHEEMAQMIGTSRETVTRLLSELKKKELIRLEGSTMVIRNRPALEALLA